MTSQTVNYQDFRFLSRVAAMQEAMHASSRSTVSVWKREDGGPGQGYAHSIFYDQTDPKAKGLAVMRERRLQARPDILPHFLAHKQFLESMLRMDAALLKNDRSGFVASCSLACNLVESYSGLVDQHTQRHSYQSFLVQPVYLPDSPHYFQVGGEHGVIPLRFNRTGNQPGVKEELGAVRKDFTEFLLRADKLPRVALAQPGKEAAGLYDPRLGVTLEHVRSLLTGVDIIVP
jgi:hypothetical protein